MKRFIDIMIDAAVGNRDGELSDGIETAVGFFAMVGIAALLTFAFAWLTGAI